MYIYMCIYIYIYMCIYIYIYIYPLVQSAGGNTLVLVSLDTCRPSPLYRPRVEEKQVANTHTHTRQEHHHRVDPKQR